MNGASGKLIHCMTETRLRMFIAGFVGMSLLKPLLSQRFEISSQTCLNTFGFKSNDLLVLVLILSLW